MSEEILIKELKDGNLKHYAIYKKSINQIEFITATDNDGKSALVYLKDAIEIKKKLEKENTCILKDEPLRVLGEAIYELDYYRRKWIEEGKYTERWVTNDEILLYLI